MHRLVPERVSSSLVLMPRQLKQALLLAADAGLLVFAAWAAYSLRLGGGFAPNRSRLLLMAAAPLLAGR